jgi:predicted membrane protein
MNATHGFRLTPQLIFGLFVIVIGVLFTLDNLGVARADEYLRFWPTVLMAIGLVKMWQSRETASGGFAGLLFTLVGTWLLLEETAVVRVSFWELWPLLLVFFGAYLVWQGMAGAQRRVGPSDSSNSTVNAIAVLGGVARGNNSRHFRGGDLTAFMGGCELDLRHAAIEGEAVIEVMAMWGGIEIRVPEDWTVISHVVPIMAGFEDKTRPPQGVTNHRLVIRGVILMAGVEVKN